ncbi:hypothetical protein ATH50_3108 [Haloplanus aerogenes]|uniref:Uncharacterized protein n=1 Tax=Haloplanus aerogenes TaxID=660522 RepID=A0A3M0CU68_9EURY|nr:hypothetical protein ATH50_3108 [Haloplanus aerogenes]
MNSAMPTYIMPKILLNVLLPANILLRQNSTTITPRQTAFSTPQPIPAN